MRRCCSAPEAEPFVGPAIFSGRAAGVFFHEIFGHRVEGHRQKDESEGQTFTKSVGTKVLPDFLSVVFDPTRRKVGGVDLNGWYDYDDEGVKARPVTVVDKGVLKTFLMSRSPIQGFDHSNGHGRRQPGLEVVSRQSNLIVESTNAVSEARLRQMLIDEIKKQNKPYGLYFRDITGGFTTTQRAGLQAFKVIPVIVYRVYADGRPDELVRGADIVGTPLASFAKILATSRQAGSIQRILRRRIGQRAGVGGFARDSGFGNRDRKEGQVAGPAPAAARAHVHGEPREAARVRRAAGCGGRGAGSGHGMERPGARRADPVLRAMHDEMERSRKLTVSNLEAPYFIEYLMDEEEDFSVSASLGGLVARRHERFRSPEVHVRVGDYKFDNTNYAGSGFAFGARYDLERFPAGRRLPRAAPVFLAGRPIRPTSRRWKPSPASARPCATSPQSEQLDDFAHAEPVHYIRPFPRLAIDEDAWTRPGARALGDFRAVSRGEEFHAWIWNPSDGGYYLVNSEGTEVRAPESATFLRAQATAQAPDGMAVRDAVTFHSLDAARMPTDAELNRGVTRAGRERGGAGARAQGRRLQRAGAVRGRRRRADFRRSAGPEPGARAAAGDGAGPRRRRFRPANWRAASARAFCPIRSTWWTTPRRRNGAAGRFSAATTWIAKAWRPSRCT